MKLVVSLTVFLTACVHHSVDPANNDALNSGKRLNQAIASYTEAIKHLDPYEAPYFNIEEDLEKFGDFGSDEYWARGEKILIEALRQLETVNPETLPSNEKLAYRLFKEDMELSLADYKFPIRYLQVNQMSNRLLNFMNSANQSLTKFPFDSIAHYDAFLKRARGFPAYVDREIRNLQVGIDKKVTLSCAIVDRVPLSYKDALEAKTEKNPFYKPVAFMPQSFPSSERERLSKAFASVIQDQLLPAYRKFDSYLKGEYRSHCRKGFGIASLPNGAEWYRHAIRINTNLSLDPREIHELGLREVARINEEMRKVQYQIGYKGTLSAFKTSVLANPDSYFRSAEDMFRAFEIAKAETAKQIPKYFSLVPQSDYKIVSTTNPEDASGSYHMPTELHPYGRFVANTINLKAIPKYDVTTLLLHEAVPGHHFQLAIGYEAKDRLTEYQRKIYGSNSFIEGWALYSEYLGNEMGLLKDPMQRFGHLNDEMLRATRLVVDSGIHSLNWSQAKANAFMRANLALDAKEIQNEVNRYSVWPGQALGYKIGQLKILELRKKAERELGAKFDIRDFHSAVIGNGNISLSVLETQVDEWIRKTKAI